MLTLPSINNVTQSAKISETKQVDSFSNSERMVNSDAATSSQNNNDSVTIGGVSLQSGLELDQIPVQNNGGNDSYSEIFKQQSIHKKKAGSVPEDLKRVNDSYSELFRQQQTSQGIVGGNIGSDLSQYSHVITTLNKYQIQQYLNNMGKH